VFMPPPLSPPPHQTRVLEQPGMPLALDSLGWTLDNIKSSVGTMCALIMLS